MPGTPVIRNRRRSPPRRKDKRYKDYVVRQGCMFQNVSAAKCEGDATDPHHFPANGRKQQGDDRRINPLCRRHHNEFHNSGTIYPWERQAIEKLFLEEQLSMLITYLDRT